MAKTKYVELDQNILICENISNTKKKFKIKDEDFKIMKMEDFELLKTHQFKVAQLKEICNFYNLKKGGNKDQLINKLYNFLKLSLHAIKIQKVIRKIFLKKFIKYGGKGYLKREICVNDTDFATLDNVKEIPFNQFFSWEQGECVYGCDIMSFYGLINKKNYIGQRKESMNPYNREKIEENTITQFKQYLKLGKINKIEQVKEIIEEPIDPKKKIELKTLELFQYINELGNYSDSNWFVSLPLHMLVMFIRELYDIWHYRAQLTPTIMREIVPPHGNPFLGLQMHLAQHQNEDYLRKSALRIMDYMVKSGHSTDNRALGAYYVLAALTLVSQEARNTLPWLYQSVAYNNS
jgi:hypothetical protein|uniref:SAP domain-containing protein n=1 Tax=viral metagenome TaxID=1070528 RepID=A0A6C0CHY4_9ZZZZ